jgi:VanZ family protein
MLMVRFSVRRAILAGYVAAMLAALLLPVPDAPSYVPGVLDKVAHVGLFFGFAVLAAWTAGRERGRRMLGAFVWASVFAALVEVLQALLPYRSGDPVDLVAGIAGALVGAVLGARSGAPNA